MSSHSLRPLARRTIAIALAACCAAPIARGNVVTITPSQDNTMYSQSGSVSNGAGVNLFAGRIMDGATRRALLRFDVAANVPAGAVINSVSLAVVCTNSAPSSGPRVLALHEAQASWGEGTSSSGGGAGAPATASDATWTFRTYNTTAWTNAGGDFDATPSATLTVDAVGPYTWSSTPALVADVQGWLDAPANNFGWTMKGDESVVQTVKSFATREEPVTANRPMLTIDFTPPVPAIPKWGLGALTALIIGSGALALARRTRAQSA